ncbi:MAG: CHASE2 domain-containing protein [bacterium]|nr:CHASE2 domain-containing protein [bacterium]
MPREVFSLSQIAMSNRKRLAGSIIAAAAFWLISLSGTFNFLEGLIYDQFFSLIKNPSGLGIHVVLVEIPPAGNQLTEKEYLRVIDILKSYEPAQVVFNFTPPEVSADFYKKIKDYNNVVVGCVSPESQAALHNHGIPTGVVLLPETENGISRRHFSGIRVNKEHQPALEVTAASRITTTGAGTLLKKTINVLLKDRIDYGVNFRGGPKSLTTVSLSRVQKNDLVPRLIKNKTLLIGPAKGTTTPGLTTPTTKNNQSMSLLEFQGHAINTLISGKIISHMNPRGKLLLFILITIPAFFVYQRLRAQIAAWTTLLIIAGFLGGHYLCFSLFQLFIPFPEMVLLLSIHFLMGIHRQNIDSELAFQDLLLNLNSKLREYYFPDNMVEVKEYWSQMVVMITQTLSLTRLIFLERQSSDHRVTEVQSFNCRLSDIDERRRDYKRAPYSDAIRVKGPWLIPRERIYLKLREEDEEQYIVPLSHFGKILGFMVFGILPVKLRGLPHFNTLIGNYAAIIGEHLHQRQKLQLNRRQNVKILQDLYSLSRGHKQEAHNALAQTVELLKRQLNHMSSVFNDMSTKTIVYDLFGRVLEVNRNMLESLKNESLSPYEMSLTDLLVKLTGFTIDETRQKLTGIITKRKNLSFIAALGDKNYMLNLKPLEIAEAGDRFDGSDRFGIHGIICEMAETTSLTRANELKDYLAGELVTSLSREMTALKKALPENVTNAHQPTDMLTTILRRFQLYLTGGGENKENTLSLPLNSVKMLELSLKDTSSAVKTRGLHIHSQLDENLPYVLATPKILRAIFERILTLLVDDTRDNSDIVIKTQLMDHKVIFDFKNDGFGMPNEKLQQFLEKDIQGADTDVINLREAIVQLDEINGEIRAGSKVGEGIHVSLSLESFRLSPKVR